MDQATKFLLFRMSRNHPKVARDNKAHDKYVIDAIAEKLSFIALMDDICCKRSPAYLIHDKCEMFQRRKIIEVLNKKSLSYVLASSEMKEFTDYLDAIFRVIKKCRQENKETETLYAFVKRIQMTYNFSQQPLIWTTPTHLFFGSNGL